MSGKNQFPVTFNWQATNPATGLLPANNPSGSIPSNVSTGTMSGTNTIYSQIIDVSKMDNIGLEINWTGNPVGTLSVLGGNSGANFYPLSTFSSTLPQPSGSASGYLLTLNQYPWKYVYFQYVNSTGTGVLTIFGQQKDLN